MRSGIYLAAGIAAVLVLAIFPLQLSVFALAWPPPETAGEYFDLLRENTLVGLLSLDLLLMADWIILLVVWAGLYAGLRERAPRTMLAALALVVASTLMYFLSNTAFTMLALSSDYSLAASATDREGILAAGATALATFDGPWFVASYILSGVAVLLASVVMWRAPDWGRPIGGIGIAYAVMQFVPPTAGMFGMIVSLVSLAPMLAWLALVARKLLKVWAAQRRASSPGARATA